MELTTKEAIYMLIEEYDLTKLTIAKDLGTSTKVIKNWLTGVRMSRKKATKLHKLYSITITDVCG